MGFVSDASTFISSQELASSHRSLNGRCPANARRPRPPSVSGSAKKVAGGCQPLVIKNRRRI